MASAARAYSRQSASARGASIRVVPGKKANNALSPVVLFAARAFMITLAVFGIVACARIGFASATVTTSLETERLSAQVESVRSGSVHLEVTESALGNPTAVKETAVKQLGMAAPEEVGKLTLSEDVVAFDDAGNLSLARSLSNKMAA